MEERSGSPPRRYAHHDGRHSMDEAVARRLVKSQGDTRVMGSKGGGNVDGSMGGRRRRPSLHSSLRLTDLSYESKPSMPISTRHVVPDLMSHLVKLRHLGNGSTGSVSLAVHVEKFQLVAVKEVKSNSRDGLSAEWLRSELRALSLQRSSLRAETDEYSWIGSGSEASGAPVCPHIVKFYGSAEAEGSVSMAVEYMNGGSLAGLTKLKCPEGWLAHIGYQIMQGLAFLHSQGRVHLDVKPANILLNKHGDAKLTDFGCAASVVEGVDSAGSGGSGDGGGGGGGGGGTGAGGGEGGEGMEDDEAQYTTGLMQGTRRYMAPERLSRGRETGAADVWSLGLTLVTAALAQCPLEASPSEFGQTCEAEMAVEKICQQRNQLSPLFMDFLCRCLVSDADLRPPAVELLGHPFFKLRRHWKKTCPIILPTLKTSGSGVNSNALVGGSASSPYDPVCLHSVVMDMVEARLLLGIDSDADFSQEVVSELAEELGVHAGELAYELDEMNQFFRTPQRPHDQMEERSRDSSHHSSEDMAPGGGGAGPHDEAEAVHHEAVSFGAGATGCHSPGSSIVSTLQPCWDASGSLEGQTTNSATLHGQGGGASQQRQQHRHYPHHRELFQLSHDSPEAPFSQPDSSSAAESYHSYNSYHHRRVPSASSLNSTGHAHSRYTPSPMDVALRLQRGLPVRKRIDGFRWYSGCFSGSEAVQWMIKNGLAKNARMAKALGGHLVDEGLVHHVRSAHLFEDDADVLYQFSDYFMTKAKAVAQAQAQAEAQAEAEAVASAAQASSRSGDGSVYGSGHGGSAPQRHYSMGLGFSNHYPGGSLCRESSRSSMGSVGSGGSGSCLYDGTNLGNTSNKRQRRSRSSELSSTAGDGQFGQYGGQIGESSHSGHSCHSCHCPTRDRNYCATTADSLACPMGCGGGGSSSGGGGCSSSSVCSSSSNTSAGGKSLLRKLKGSLRLRRRGREQMRKHQHQHQQGRGPNPSDGFPPPFSSQRVGVGSVAAASPASAAGGAAGGEGVRGGDAYMAGASVVAMRRSSRSDSSLLEGRRGVSRSRPAALAPSRCSRIPLAKKWIGRGGSKNSSGCSRGSKTNHHLNNLDRKPHGLTPSTAAHSEESSSPFQAVPTGSAALARVMVGVAAAKTEGQEGVPRAVEAEGGVIAREEGVRKGVIPEGW